MDDVRGRLLVVATARPELEWGGGRRHVTAIELEPLADEVSAQLVADLPETVRELLVRRSEGNPFFVEELIESLVDSGVLAQRDDRWEVAALPDQLSMPDSVRGVLAARIDLLPAREKAALQAASVIGRVFWEAPVRELIGGDADFALLEERDFIRRRTGSRFPGDREHQIKHALTREAAYAGIPRARRARMHATLAEWIERSVENVGDIASLLAHHYADAVRPEDVELAWAGDDAELKRTRATRRPGPASRRACRLSSRSASIGTRPRRRRTSSTEASSGARGARARARSVGRVARRRARPTPRTTSRRPTSP